MPRWTAFSRLPAPEPPLREELLDAARLQDCARLLAATLTSAPRPRRAPALARLADNVRRLDEAHRLLAADARQHEFVGPAGEWLLDNYHLVDAEVRALRHDMPRRFYRRLPFVRDGETVVARVEALARAFIAHIDSRVDRGPMLGYLDAFQTVAPLTLGELWAWPSIVRLVLLENLRRLADGVLAARDARRAADAYLDAIDGPGGFRPPVWPAQAPGTFTSRLVQRLREEGESRDPVGAAITARLDAQGTTREDVVRDDHQHQAAAQVLVANVITSLRLCATIDWSAFVEATSVVDQVLRRDPAGAYARMDFPSRDAQRKAIEALAPFDGPGQQRAAQAAVDAAQTAGAPGERTAHVGYHLIGRGRPALERQLGVTPPFVERLRRAGRRRAGLLYAGAITAATSALLLLVVQAALAGGASPGARVVLGLAFLLPALDLAIALVNRVVTAIVAPLRLPRLDFREGLPAEARTMVCVPTLLTSLDGVQHLLEQLEVAALANPDSCLHFAILSDFADAVNRETPGDRALIEAAVRGVEALNAAAGAPDRFFFFHRERLFNPAEGVWMGWERKRGKIEEFNRRVRGARDTSYAVEVGDVSRLAEVRYCLTLDADTRLPRDAARTLVGIIEHPLNRPRIDAREGRVVEGYGILQPRVSVAMTSASSSLFTRLYAGHTGVDPYTTAVSDVYQDLFGEGIFTGKGLYDVDTFTAVLDGRVPDNAVLSHDLFEGLFARAGLVTDVEVIDDYPASVLAHARRQHRWVRGDWQILRWLFPFVPTRGGLTQNRLPLGARWKILDNLRRSLTAPATLAALFAAWLFAPAPPLPWTLAALAAPLAPLVLRLLGGLARTLRLRMDTVALAAFAGDLRIDAARALLDVTLVAQTTWAMLHAIGLTLTRMWVTRRRLLEWETAATSAARASGRTVWGFALAMIASPVTAALSLLTVALFRVEAVPDALPFVLAWLTAPFVAHALSQPAAAAPRALADDDRVWLREVARDTWRYFEQYATAEHHALPPDNVQFTPDERVAARTSPTNIGMGLLSTLAAHDLGFIPTPVLADRLDATLSTVEQLEKVHGHLLNWYDTRTLAPLRPAYVSTVDSGNLAGALLTLASGLEGLAAAGPAGDPVSRRLTVLAARALRIVDDTDFAFLFDSRRELFAVGYRVADEDGPGRLDTSYYDLLASESRLASFIAIARGDVPQRHWFRLGRPLTVLQGRPVLLSWSATMFEYLMPALVMRAYPDTLLTESCRAAVGHQRDYGEIQGTPWGISESAYAAVDRHDTYQYRAFGVPGLGFARGLSDDLVVAPYATALALPFAPRAAVDNLRRLDALGARGPYGFFEAMDYTDRTPAREHVATPPHTDGVVVRTCMSHHQGMALVAIGNALLGDLMVDRFHRLPLVRATDLLLQERVPRPPAASVRPSDDDAPVPARAATVPVRRYRTPHTPAPHAQLLSNGQYVVAVTNGGGGASAWRGQAVTRWRRDATCDPASQAVFLRDVRSGACWSAGYQPTCAEPDDYVVTFHPDKATFLRRDGELSTQLDVAVSPEHDMEVRRVTLRNHGAWMREIEVTSYVEVALAAKRDDLAHPAFGKLFVETEFSPDNTAILCRRRPRHGADELWAVHVLSFEGRASGPVEWETDRERFIGRGQSLAAPQALDGRALSGTTGVVLDPICSLRQRVRVPPGGQVRLSVSTGVAPDREAALRLAQTYHHPNAASRTFALAFTQAQSLLQHLGVTPEDVRVFERLASPLHYVDESVRAPAAAFGANTLGQAGLWRHGISGDLPIVLVRVSDDGGGPALVRQVLQAQEYFRLKGLASETVIVNQHPESYLDEMQAQLAGILASGPWRTWQGQPGGAWLLRGDALSSAENGVLDAVARVVLMSGGGDLRAQLDPPPVIAVADVPAASAVLPLTGTMLPPAPPVEAAVTGTLTVGLGRFERRGREFALEPRDRGDTPVPWSNVIANPRFGTVVTTGGTSYTWAVNSRENRLTPFANDPVCDASAEHLYLRDDDAGVTWTPTPGLRQDRLVGPVDVRHAPGRTRFARVAHGIASTLDVFVDLDAPVKCSLLTLTNETTAARRLAVVPYCQWALGPPTDGQHLHVATRYDAARGMVTATNPFNDAFAGRVAFLAASHPPRAATGDRAAFLGRHGSHDAPAGLTRGLVPRFGGGLDPCAALEIGVTLGPGESAQLVVVLGQGDDQAHAEALVSRFAQVTGALEARCRVDAHWAALLDTVQVRTPDDSFDTMMNTWLLYQTLACRIDARTGYFQPGGAFGFRDQIQDVLALCHAAPAVTRAHLLRAAGRQFVEGDVQHWWHEPSGRGLRSRCSDDLLWLPFAVAEYVRQTGDETLLQEQVPFLVGPPLEPEAVESYNQPQIGPDTGTMLEHCRRAADRARPRGQHGLPLFGGGDWNDGMNLVGAGGRGESTWLGFFLFDVYDRVAWMCERSGDTDAALTYRREAARLTPALEAAWDGEWYRRGYYDDGTTLGSAHNDECRLDSIAQSWAVLSGAVPVRFAERAMDSVRAHLVSRGMRTVALLAPPFNHSAQEPGYIKGYPPGLRENGGQYTHAAAWVIMALAALGSGDEAMELFHLINPVNRSRTPADVEQYRLEPYVVAGDVYTHPAHPGRGGWSWYTGSAGWLYRAGLEQLLGLRRHGATFSIDPCVPSAWPAFEIDWRTGTTTWHIRVINPRRSGRGVASARVDGREVDPDAIPIAGDGQAHVVEIVLGGRSTMAAVS